MNNEWGNMYASMLKNEPQPLSVVYIRRYRSYGFQKTNFGNSRPLSFYFFL